MVMWQLAVVRGQVLQPASSCKVALVVLQPAIEHHQGELQEEASQRTHPLSTADQNITIQGPLPVLAYLLVSTCVRGGSGSRMEAATAGRLMAVGGPSLWYRVLSPKPQLSGQATHGLDLGLGTCYQRLGLGLQFQTRVPRLTNIPGKLFRDSITTNCLTVRTARQWNQLPLEAVSTPMLEAFKRKLDNQFTLIWISASSRGLDSMTSFQFNYSMIP